MKKKLHIFIIIASLLLSLIPDIIRGYKVISDEFKTDRIELINKENISLSYDVQETNSEYKLRFYYKVNPLDKNEKIRLKLKFESNNSTQISQNTDWLVEEGDRLISDFGQNTEGVIDITSKKPISQLDVKIQADIIRDKNIVQENIIQEKVYHLLQPKIQHSEEKKEHTIVKDNNINTKNKAVDEASKVISDITFPYPSNFGLRPLPLNNSKNYNNIVPNYITDDKGIYPTFSWIPSKNQTVINYQGWKNGNWDGGTSWNGSPDNKINSYIEYPGERNPVDFAIRKYAKETTTPGLYDVYLNVRGNEQNPIKPIDIVLVVDMSGSMEKEKASAIRKGVKDFLSTIQDTAYSDHVNVGIVGYSSPGYLGEDKGYITVPMDKVSSTNHVDSINKALSPTFSGGTFTQLGIREGTKMLEEDTNDHQKMMIVMTDGVPTFSYKVDSASKTNNVIYGETFKSSRDEPSNTSKIGKPYDVTNINGG
jgi:Mg-chelatase subunit ChlD